MSENQQTEVTVVRAEDLHPDPSPQQLRDDFTEGWNRVMLGAASRLAALSDEEIARVIAMFEEDGDE